MFTAGLELLTCAAELSGPTGPSLGRCRGGGVGLSPAWPLLMRCFLAGDGGGGYSCFTLWSPPSKTRSFFSLAACLLTQPRNNTGD